MTNTIRKLTSKDWAIIEPVLESRMKFQNRPVPTEWHDRMKRLHVLGRIDRKEVDFFGYFIDTALVAIASFQVVPSDTGLQMAIGTAWTMAGLDLPKWQGSRWASALIELRHHALDIYEAHGLTAVWTLRPSDRTWSTQAEVSGSYLTMGARYSKEFWGTVTANTVPSDSRVFDYLMVGVTLPQDQDVYLYTVVNPVKYTPPMNVTEPVIPADAPIPFTRPPPDISKHPIPTRPRVNVAPPPRANT